jgi:integrase
MSYTTPLPSTAKILRRKAGPVAKFTTARGEEVVAPLSKSGKRVRMTTAHFVLEFRDHNDVLRRLKASNDEAVSQRFGVTVQDLLNARGSCQGIGQDLRRRIEALPKAMRTELARWGLLDERANTATKPLRELIAVFIESMRARELDPQHIRANRSDLTKLCEACGFTFLSDITGPKVEAYLKQLRDAGTSYCRSNHVLVTVKAFMAWLMREGVTQVNPVVNLKPLNEREDRRHPRRALEVNELKRLLETTKQSPGKLFGLTGQERYLVYRLATETGLRRGEITKLTVACFDFDRGVVTLDAKYTKNKKGAKLPLRKDTAEELRDFCRDKLPTATVFKMPWATSVMIRKDLEAAGLPYQDEAGRFFDFHCLRGEFGTLLAMRGVHPKTAQVLMRHHDVNLTLNLYTHVLAGQESAAIESLPDFSVAEDEQGKKVG